MRYFAEIEHLDILESNDRWGDVIELLYQHWKMEASNLNRVIFSKYFLLTCSSLKHYVEQSCNSSHQWLDICTRVFPAVCGDEWIRGLAGRTEPEDIALCPVPPSKARTKDDWPDVVKKNTGLPGKTVTAFAIQMEAGHHPEMVLSPQVISFLGAIQGEIGFDMYNASESEWDIL